MNQCPRKQRHTARRIWQRLGAEHDTSLSKVTVSRYVQAWRREHGKTGVEVVVPQTHEPGAEAEVGEFYAVIAGVSTKSPIRAADPIDHGLCCQLTSKAFATETKSAANGFASPIRVATTTLLTGNPSSDTVARSERSELRRSPTGRTATA
jgi:hypothetical protein